MESRRGIKIVSWNVTGIANLRRALGYVSDFDVVILQETLFEKELGN